MASDVLEDLRRLCAPWDASPLILALTTENLGPYGRDGEWHPHHHGRPRGPAGTFDGDALLHGVQALAFLSFRVPVGDPLQQRLGPLYRAILERLKNPGLLIEGGNPTTTERDEALTARGAGAYVFHHSYCSICPAKVVTDEQRAFLRGAQELLWPNATYPWFGLFSVVEAVQSQGFRALMARVERSPLPADAWELDPRRSAPVLVAKVRQAHGLEEDAATLYLQLLTLVDAGDALLCQANGWPSARLKQAGAALVAKRLVLAKKQPRATRSWCLPGPWEALRPPHPATERSKLALYDAHLKDGALAAPLGRVLPLRPLPELFEAALAAAAAVTPEPEVDERVTRDWLHDIVAAPDDDAPRLVYADWLLEQGEPRGEFIQVQCQLARAPTPALRAREAALLQAHEERWLGDLRTAVTGATWHRGFITQVRALAPDFAKHAPRLFEREPLLTGFCFDAVISPAQVRALAQSPSLARFTSLDTSPDHYFSQVGHLRTLLESPHFPQALEWLRLGFHRPGEGLGLELADLLVDCGKLRALEHLELAGQLLGQTFMGAHRGTRALERLLAGLPALKVLRVPYNGFLEVDAHTMAERLAAGLAPQLEVLDFANLVDTDFVTKAVDYQGNRVSKASQARVNAALSARRGQPAPAQVPPPGPFPDFSGPLPQTGRFPFVEKAKSGRARCVVCQELIAKDSLRVGLERRMLEVGRVTAWVHVGCRAQCPELANLADLDAQLTAKSAGVWPPAP